MTRIHKSILVFIAVSTYFGFLAAPDITWSNTGVDNGSFILAAMSFPEQVLIHPSGYPLFNFINGLFSLSLENSQQISHVLSILVGITSGITAGLLYYIGRGYIAPLIFISSNVVVSQSMIVEVYALATLFSVLLYMTRDSRWFSVVAFFALGTHHLVGLALIPIIVYRWKSNKWDKSDLLIPLAFVMYIPMFFGNIPELVGWSDPTLKRYFGGQSFMILGLSPEDGGILRLIEGLSIFFGGLGITSFVFLKFIKEKFRTDTLLIVIAILPFLFYWTHLLPQAFTYTMPGFAFIGILIAKYYRTLNHVVTATMALGFVIMIGGNAILFHQDNPTARDFVTQLESLPEDSIVWTNTRGWEQLSSWPEKLSVKVVATDTNLIRAGLIPTHISVTTDSRYYASTIVACSGWIQCRKWSERDTALEFDTANKSSDNVLAINDFNSSLILDKSREDGEEQ